MELFAIVADAGGVCTRQRVELFRPALGRAGIELEVAELPPSGTRRRMVLNRGREADAVLLLRRLLVWADLRRLRRAARRLVYDYDDALWLRDPSRRRSFSWRARIPR